MEDLGSRQMAKSGKQVRKRLRHKGGMAGVHAELRVLAWSSLQTVHLRPLVKTGPQYLTHG